MSGTAHQKHPWLDPEEITNFIEDLREQEGYKIGLSQHIAALNLRFKLAELTKKSQNDPSEFQKYLGPILCSSEFEQANFPKLYNKKFSVKVATEQAVEKTPIQREYSEAIEEIKRKPFIIWRLVLAILMTLLLFSVDMNWFAETTDEQITDGQTTDGQTTNGQTTDGQTTNGQTTDGQTTDGQTTDGQTTDGQALGEQITDEQINEANWLVRFWFVSCIIAVVVLLGVILRSLWWYYQANQYLKRFPAKQKPDTAPLWLQSINEDLFPRQVLFYTAKAFRQGKRVTSAELDVDLMVEKYAIQGGISSSIHKNRKISREYLFLIDSASQEDHLAAFAKNIALQLKQQDVYLDIYTFDGDPRLCFPEDSTKAAVSLKELFNSYYNCRLIIFSDAVSWVNPLTGKLEAWVEALKDWSERVIFTPRRPDTWGQLEKNASQYAVVLFSSIYELSKPVQEFNDANSKEEDWLGGYYPEELSWRSNRWLERDELDAPEPEVIDGMLLSLSSYLDAAGYYWLCACAVFPKLHWDLTLYLGHKLFTENFIEDSLVKEKLFNHERLNKLSRLPWFRYGYIPNWLRKRFIYKLSKSQEKEARKAIGNLFKSASEGFASGESIEIALSGSSLPNPLRREVFRKLNKESEEDSPIKDYIFKKFIYGGIDLLAFKLPVQVRVVRNNPFFYLLRGFYRLALFCSILVLVIFVNGDNRIWFDVLSNDDWKPAERDFDGTTMVLVPRGSFVMGSNEEERKFALELCNEARTDREDCKESFFEDEEPVSRQYFTERFWIDKTEVTRAAYQKCVEADSDICKPIEADLYSSEENQPINNVTWYQAAKYCVWRGARLPTESEWEYAARGPDGLIYPWGNNMVGNEANHCDSNCVNSAWSGGFTYKNPNHDDGFAETSPVGSYSDKGSWVGALDMSGNLWEWTSSLYKDYPYVSNDGKNLTGNENNISESVTLRGGSFVITADALRAANRDGDTAGFGSNLDGFRCARSNSVF